MTQAAGEAQEVRRSFGLRMVVAVLGLVATFGTSVLAVRALDARPAAGFLAVLGALMLGPMVGRLGLGQSAIRAISAAPGPGEVAVQVVAHLRAVALLSLLTAPAVAWLATAVVQDDRGRVVLLVAAMIVLETVRLTVSDVFAALGRIPWSVAATHHSRSIIALVAMGVVVLASGGSTTLLTLLTVYAGTSLALLAVVLSALLVGLPRRARGTGRRWWAPMLAAVAAGAWLFTVELGAFLVGRGDVWLAGWAFGAQDALEYSTASVLAMQVTVLEGLANIAIAPVAARMWAAGEHARVFRLLSASATLSTAVTVLAVALAWLLGPQALALYGDGLGDAAPYLGVLATGGLGMAVCGSCAVLLVVTGNGRAAAGSVTVAMLVAVPAAVLAARLGGPLPLAVASAVATAVLFGSYVVACRRTFGRAPLPTRHLRTSLLVLAGRDAAAPASPETEIVATGGGAA
ncbi:lipopolysaccharide biosynthesis protein [Modestobacter roseus]|uniref:lipopolysaccharide biosynthesis protein n=1 Tax=Modestobacter roseus TaxID=1181884 RepID=UPI001295ADEF|nr:teichoic acid transporter [Modestobacter roseus]MQA33997.1 teichoic acid transporter [Modestobacter roseus]